MVKPKFPLKAAKLADRRGKSNYQSVFDKTSMQERYNPVSSRILEHLDVVLGLDGKPIDDEE